MSPSVRNIIAWILQALLAAMFMFSGGHKLMDLAGTAKMFTGMGFPGWFAGLIGGAEVLADAPWLASKLMPAKSQPNRRGRGKRRQQGAGMARTIIGRRPGRLAAGAA